MIIPILPSKCAGVVLFMVLLSSFLNGQTNLVSNGGFENYSSCPTAGSQIDRSYWRQPVNHTGSSDFFNGCATSGGVGVPTNTFGNVPAASGVGYAGGGLYNFFFPTYREYIMDTLTQPLVAGKQYVVSFQYRAAENCDYFSDDLGFHLSATIPTITTIPTHGSLGMIPTSHNPSGNFLTNTTYWATYSDTITATGGEEYIVIGSFDSVPSFQIANLNNSFWVAYMFFDEVMVYEHLGLGGDTFTCLDSTARVYSLLGEPVTWYDELTGAQIGSNGQDTIYVSSIIDTTTVLAVTDSGDTFQFTIYPVLMPSNFVGPDTNICPDDTLNRLVVLNGYSYLWSDGDTDSLFQTVDTGNHWLEIEQEGCYARDTFSMGYLPYPIFDLGSDTSICDYDSILLDPNPSNTGPFSFNWNTGQTSSTITVGDTGTYSVEIANSNCTLSDTIEISILPQVSVDLGADSALCYQQSVDLFPNVQGASNFMWSTGSTGSTLTITSSGTYGVTVEGAGCMDSSEVTYTFHFDPSFDLGNDTSYCRGDSLLLSTGLDAATHNFFWMDGSTTPTYAVTDDSQGLYWVHADNGICGMTDTIQVGVYAPLGLDLGVDVKACEGDTIGLLANTSPSYEYSWNTGSVDNSIQVSSSGVYQVTVFDGTCSDADTAQVTFYKTPNVSLGPDTILCDPAQLTLRAKSSISNLDYRWFNGSTSKEIVVSIDSSVVTYVEVTNEVCTSTDSLLAVMQGRPEVKVTADTLLCPGREVYATAFGDDAFIYEWSNGTVGRHFNTAVPGDYQLVVRDGVCDSVYPLKIQRYRPNKLVITGPTEICIGEEHQLTVEGDNFTRYEWGNGVQGPTRSISESGYYSVQGWDVCGVIRDSILIENCECYVRLPNAFRPVPGSFNKTFGPIVYCEQLEYLSFTVYDRWGGVLFSTTDPTESWDGTFGNKIVPLGTYTWRVDYEVEYQTGGHQETLFGTVTVLY